MCQAKKKSFFAFSLKSDEENIFAPLSFMQSCVIHSIHFVSHLLSICFVFFLSSTLFRFYFVIKMTSKRRWRSIAGREENYSWLFAVIFCWTCNYHFSSCGWKNYTFYNIFQIPLCWSDVNKKFIVNEQWKRRKILNVQLMKV